MPFNFNFLILHWVRVKFARSVKKIVSSTLKGVVFSYF
jgi:hypothetical protein